MNRTNGTGPLALPLQKELEPHAKRLKELAQSTAENLWEMGRILADAQERLSSHNGGSFRQWVEEEAGLSKGTAYRMMDVYRAFSRPNLGQPHFSTSALYALSKPSTPQEARDEALFRAQRGEPISHATARQIVSQYRPLKPALPPLPEKPPLPPSPEYTAFEKDELLPHLHDAGMEDAPQILSGHCEAFWPVPEEHQEKARTNIRESVVAQLEACRDREDVDKCADAIMELFGHGNQSISIASRFGAAIAQSPRTLADLTEICIATCGGRNDRRDRDRYLGWRKRALRLVDALSYGNGLPIYEHKLSNGQLAYSLIPCETEKGA